MTIKQLADELGVSKHKVKYQLRKLSPSCVEKDGDIIRIKPSGITALRNILMDNSPNKSSEIRNTLCGFCAHLLGEIEVLRGELDTKNRQIETLSKALDSAQQTAAHAQALHAGTIQHLPDKKQGFWAKLLRRN